VTLFIFGNGLIEGIRRLRRLALPTRIGPRTAARLAPAFFLA
jgi:hypothetical protein